MSVQKPLADLIGATPARERLIKAHEALVAPATRRGARRAKHDVEGGDGGVLIETAEKIANEVSDRLDEFSDYAR